MEILCYRGEEQLGTEGKIHVVHQQRELLFEIPLHRHDHYEFFLVHDGSVGHILNGVSAPLSAGTLAFFLPEDVHRFEDEGHFVRCVNYVVQPAFFERVVEQWGGDALWRFLRGDGKFMQLDRDAASRLLEVSLAYSSFNEIDPLQFSLLALTLGEVILSAMLRKNRDIMPEWMNQVVKAYQLASNYTQPVDALYAMCGRSPAHVCRSFRKYLSTTPTRFLNELRLNRARMLLRGTRHSVLKISLMSGFDSLSHFNHLFRERYGKSPSEFRSSQIAGPSGAEPDDMY